ncbi:Carbonic anhydrase or acetyltransferase, isoleucine patch superfamily [Hydrobacter penzbergensis]|uniref:Carbonic anhydrase or acetyltransferase, isoleucine patch superfamily n=1 Tax=Hydrobacter penzbergensis TaxID=1235997 RepID=A0A8X8IFC6_9BACT|nr:acyltransferase [Hydrobacter penzbergensis]SDW85713.1 Carbonic anhydrase or acetyltransferase, isoleucine patch superfamily [Hydrobacter penzbergensis]
MKNNAYIHPTAEVQTQHIGSGTKIWQHSVVLAGAVIGNNCNINFNCFIENDVTLGNNVTVKSGIFLWDGITCEDDVFLGPNVVFTNDIRPRSKAFKTPVRTLIKQGASIGANSTILAGITIGKYAMTGIGSVVTKDIPDYALFYGNPAKFKGWVDKKGNKLLVKDNLFYSEEENKNYMLKDGKLVELQK